MKAYDDLRFFDLVKHHAAVLQSNFRWVSCHVLGDGTAGVSYRERSGRIDGVEHATPSRTMSATDVISIGRMIEARPRSN